MGCLVVLLAHQLVDLMVHLHLWVVLLACWLTSWLISDATEVVMQQEQQGSQEMLVVPAARSRMEVGVVAAHEAVVNWSG